jgi:hypothetical protein
MSIFEVICNRNEQGESVPARIVFERDIMSIRGISDRWQDGTADYFKVVASDGETYLLRQALDGGDWSLAGIGQV